MVEDDGNLPDNANFAAPVAKPPAAEPPAAASPAVETVYSAFKIVYLVTFILAIVDLAYTGINDVAKNEPDGAVFSRINVACWNGVLIFFLLVVSAHIVRIYFTLDHLERQQFQFVNFYRSFSGKLRLLEYISRISLVFVVSLKAISPVTAATLTFLAGHAVAVTAVKDSPQNNVFTSLPKFLLWLYAALLTWSILAMLLGKKSGEEAFLKSSVIGLLGAVSVYFGQTFLKVSEVLVPASLFLAAWGTFLLFDLRTYFKTNSSNYTSVNNLKSIFFG